jgi:hypothetical protein
MAIERFQAFVFGFVPPVRIACDLTNLFGALFLVSAASMR